MIPLFRILFISLTVFFVTCSKNDRFPVIKGEYLGQAPPGKRPEPFAPGIINTKDKNHSSVAVSPDGKKMYWSLFSHISGVRQERIWFMKMENGVWSRPQVAPFSGNYRDGQPGFSPDGSRLYFSSLRPVSEDDDTGDANIWYVEIEEKDGTEKSEPVCLDSIVNTEDQEWFPSVAKNRNIYYGLLRKNSATSWDIYCSKFVNGVYSVPEKLSNAVNGDYFDGTPYINPDERFIIFFSERPNGRFDEGKLFISYRDSDGSWTDAKPLNDRINASVSRFPNISPDGKYFFFTSLKNDSEDIYWVDAGIIEDFTPGGFE